MHGQTHHDRHYLMVLVWRLWVPAQLALTATAHLPLHHQTLHPRYHTVALLAKAVHSLAQMLPLWQTLSEKRYESRILRTIPWRRGTVLVRSNQTMASC